MLLLTCSPAVAFLLLLTFYPGVSNRTMEPEPNQTHWKTKRSIEFSNRTKSNNYFAESSIMEPIEQNRTQSNSIRFHF